MREEENRPFEPREHEISVESIGEYVAGCQEVAMRLHTVTEKILEDGKRPVILIPSRGAVPIFLLAHEALKDLDERHFLVDPSKVRYYPQKVFQYLSDSRIAVNGPNETVADVVLYPFTADVSAERNGEEWLARKLRESCSRAFLELINKKGEYPDDLAWYYFLMGKLQRELHDEQKLNPAAIVEALKGYPKHDNDQVVLIDTVVSGRAAQDITGAFAALGHRVVPILAVDSRAGGHFQHHRKAEIEKATKWEYLGDQNPFVEFPLITEDRGAALLGVAAINFANFNKSEIFRAVDIRFKSDFIPQSCLWIIPPGNLRHIYTEGTFFEFLKLCLAKVNGENIEPLIPEFLNKALPLISSHGNIAEKEVKTLVGKVDNGATGRETASHIVSLTINDKQAADWIKEFASSLFNNK